MDIDETLLSIHSSVLQICGNELQKNKYIYKVHFLQGNVALLGTYYSKVADTEHLRNFDKYSFNGIYC